MKDQIKKIISAIIVMSMLLSMVPLVYAAEEADEFAGLETLAETPFEFTLEPGDLPYELLREAVLDARDIPACIDPALAEERGHVNRLYLQEPDNYTVMFQNRDGSKTVYVFSHPVKGMTMTTTASIQVNGTVVSFAGDNAITSLISELTSFNIGSAEIAYIPTGILSSDGIDLTEDARDWARGESTEAVLSYNISVEAATEYAASVTQPDTAVAAAAVTPGMTITPINPAPLGGMTVMSISSSDLAGLMSFKNVSTNRYLALSTSSSPSLTTSSSIVVRFAQWAVQYDSFFGYVISNFSNLYNTYLGFDNTDCFIIDCLGPMANTFSLSITSTTNSTVNISCDEFRVAIDSDTSLYDMNYDEDEFPASCEWKIMRKTDLRLVKSISVPETTRIEQSGVGFYLDYTLNPSNATHYEVGLYYASTGQSVEHDTEVSENDEYEYFVNTPGEYTVYYKDSVTGVRSPNFTLTVVDHIIIPESDVRIEQKNEGFTLDYTFYPGASSYSNVKLYYADTNTVVPHTGNTYSISTAGIYTVYYKDSVSGVTSENFALIVVESLTTYKPKDTYSITPASMPIESDPLYLTMDNRSNSNDRLVLIKKNPNDVKIDRGDGANHYIKCEELANVSRTFTFKYADDSQNMEDGVYISATMCTSQYGQTPDGNLIKNDGYTYTGNYAVIDSDSVANTLVYSNNSVSLIAKENGTLFKICNMGSYYLIIYNVSVSNNTSIVRALKINDANNDVEIAVYDGSDSFKWRIEQVGVDAPAIKQVNNQWCGPTSFLQVLYGMDVDVAGDNLYQEQLNIKTAWMMNGAVSTFYYCNYMNGLDDNNNPITRWLPQEYTCKEIENPTEQQLRTNIRNSLDNGAACIIFTTSGGKPYKYSYQTDGFGNVYAHYICVIGYDEVSDTVILSNCHYWYSRFGIHEVDFRDFCEDVGRLLYFENTSTQQGGS